VCPQTRGEMPVLLRRVAEVALVGSTSASGARVAPIGA
jgi:hypothetical protein